MIKKCFTWKSKLLLKLAAMITAMLACEAALAQDLAAISSIVYTNFANLSKLITGGSYVAGLGFAVAAIMKFKAHKDNPTQVPIGTPTALIMVAASLLFLPSILGVTGETLFLQDATVSSSTGTAWEP